MDLNSAAIRRFLIQYFDDAKLNTLCFDYFPKVYRDFSQGMPKSQKVQLLLDYCQQHGLWADLMPLLQRERPQTYDAELSAITVTTTPQPLQKHESYLNLAPAPHNFIGRDGQPRELFIGRDEQLSKMKRLLLAKGHSGVYAISGIPGVGKTALAAKLAHDRQVMEHFPDGVLWAGLGREPNVLYHLTRWARRLGVQQGILNSEEELQRVISETIRDSRMLLVVDDVWQSEALQFFLVQGHYCALLFTTRIKEIAYALPVSVEEVVELSPAHSLELLETLAPEAVGSERELARQLVKAVGGLPLALTILGNKLRIESQVGQAQHTEELLRRYQQAEERLNEEEHARFWREYYPSLSPRATRSLATIIGLTDEELDEDTRRAFYSLSVFPPKPNTFSEEAANFVAAGTNSDQTVRQLVNYGLLEKGQHHRYTFHQTIADYARYKLTDEAAYARMGDYFSSILSGYRRPYAYFDKEARHKFELDQENIEASLDWYDEQDLWPNFALLASGYCSFLTTTSQWQQVIKRGEEGVMAASRAEDNLTIAHLCGYVLAWALWTTGKYEESRNYCRKAIEAAESLDDANQNIYVCFASHNLHKSALEEFQNTSDRTTIERCLEEIEIYAEQCLNSAQKTEGAPLHSQLVGVAYGDMGWKSLAVGRYREAEEWFRKRLQLLNKKYRIHIVARQLDIAIALIGQEKHDEAEDLLLEALPIAQENKRHDITAGVYLALARVERSRGHLRRAETKEIEARKLWNKVALDREPFVYILDKAEPDKG